MTKNSSTDVFGDVRMLQVITDATAPDDPTRKMKKCRTEKKLSKPKLQGRNS